MIEFQKRKFKVDQVVELLSVMPRIRATENGPYSYRDRAADFLGIFSDERGQRVLSQIAQICDPTPLPGDADKHGTLAYKSGMRRVMAEIMLCMAVKEPVSKESE